MQESWQSILGDGYSRHGDETNSVFETDLFDEQSMKYPTRLAIADMSCRQYELREGLVGKVAASGTDLWIYSDDIGSMEFLSKMKFPDQGWLIPTKACIKTTLLTPIFPYGVIQLGSSEKVAKSLAAVADIKDRFNALQCTTFTESFTSDENALLVSSILKPEMDKDESSVASSSFCKITESEYLEETHATGTAEDKFSTSDQVMLPFTIGNCPLPEDFPAISPFTIVQDISSLYLDLDIESYALNQSFIADIPGKPGNMWTFSCQEEGYDDDDGVSRESSCGVSDPLFTEQIPKTGQNNVQTNYELHEVNLAALQIKSDRHSYDPNVSLEDFGASAMEPSGWFDNGDDHDQLLEALVANLYNNSDGTISSRSTSSKSSLTSLEESAPLQVQISLGTSAMDENKSVHGEFTMLSWEPKNYCEFPTSPSSFESLVSEIVEDEKPVICDYGLSDEIENVPRFSRCKAKPESKKDDRHPQNSFEANVYFGGDFDPSVQKNPKWFDKGSDQDQFSEAVFTSLYSKSDDTIRSSLTSLEESAPSLPVQMSFDTSAHGECTMLSWEPNTYTEFPTSPSSFDSLLSEIVEDQHPVKCAYGLSNENPKVHKFSRSEATTESNHRQRPKDRQLITENQLKESLEKNVYFGGASGWFDIGSDQEQLLEAVITSLYNNSDDTTSSRSTSSRSSLTSLEETAPSLEAQISFHETTSIDRECTTLSWEPSTYTKFLTSSPSLFEHLASDKSTKLPKFRRHEPETKSSHKQRPRDRQLIQDRLKELRELVPNGEKCSIDGVLDQTIKHMMFLKSVTKQSDKVKKYADKLMPQNDRKDASNHCWGAFELEDNHASCPVIVKDLEHPGQLLIQMLCNNDEVFFEMVEVMYELKLTILKGVMGTFCNNWARFIVQAAKGFNRLDIFWPLMRILQRNGNWTMN